MTTPRGCGFRTLLLACSFATSGCIVNNAPPAQPSTVPATPASPAPAAALSPGEGPRLEWGRNFYVVLDQAEAPGSYFNVFLEGDWAGIVYITNEAGLAVRKQTVEWYCWPHLDPTFEKPRIIPRSLRVEAAAMSRTFFNCFTQFEVASFESNDAQVENDRTKLTVRLGIGRRQAVSERQIYELSGRRSQDPSPRVLGECTVEQVEPDSCACVLWGNAAREFGQQEIRSGWAHLKQARPSDAQIADWLQRQAYSPERAFAQPAPQPELTPGVAPRPAENQALSEARERPRSNWSTDQSLAVAGFSLGALGVGIGGWLAFDAKDDYDEAHQVCGDSCTGAPYDQIQSARSQGWVATGFIGAGVAAAAAGFYFWFARPLEQTAAEPSGSSSLTLDGIAIDGRMATVRGRF